MTGIVCVRMLERAERFSVFTLSALKDAINLNPNFFACSGNRDQNSIGSLLLYLIFFTHDACLCNVCNRQFQIQHKVALFKQLAYLFWHRYHSWIQKDAEPGVLSIWFMVSGIVIYDSLSADAETSTTSTSMVPGGVTRTKCLFSTSRVSLQLGQFTVLWFNAANS